MDSAASKFPAPDEESTPHPSHPHHFLPRHQWERAEQLYLRLVWQLQGLGEEIAAEWWGLQRRSQGLLFHPSMTLFTDAVMAEPASSSQTPPTSTMRCSPAARSRIARFCNSLVSHPIRLLYINKTASSPNCSPQLHKYAHGILWLYVGQWSFIHGLVIVHFSSAAISAVQHI